MKKFIRKHVWVILAVLIVTVTAPALAITLERGTKTAHAVGTTPSITVPAVLHPFDVVTIGGQGFAPYDDVVIDLNWTSNPIGTIHCDSNGNCSGQVTIPYTGLTQGTYPVIATGSTGLTTQVSSTILPGVATFVPSYWTSPRLTSGGPGTAMQLEGGGFNSNETVALYWGKNNAVSLGPVTTGWDGSFSVQINAPIPATPGYNPINVVRSNQVPATITTTFRILPPSMTSSAGIRNGRAAYVVLSGFAANEQVTLSWNANGGQTITTVAVNSVGYLDTFISPPSAPKGSYTLQALGATSQLHAQSSITIGPGILLSPNTTNPGGTIVALGGGFSPGEKVNVYFQNTSNGITVVSVGTSGNFNVTLSVPTKYSIHSTYYVHAVSTTSADSAQAHFYYTTPSIQLPCCTFPAYGTSFTLNGLGFVPQETVKITAQNSVQQNPVTLGTAIVATDGTFAFTSTMPSAPYIPSGVSNGINMFMYAIGYTSKIRASTSFHALPNAIPTPGSAQIGQKVALQGGGFGSNETVSIQFQGTQLTTASTDNNGAFKATISIPSSAQVGGFPCILCVRGNISGANVSAAFTFLSTITISPQKGSSGTPIIVKGVGLYMYDGINIDWFDPASNTQTSLTSFGMNGTNSFQVTVTAPSILTSGKTYAVQIEGGSGLLSQLPFQAT